MDTVILRPSLNATAVTPIAPELFGANYVYDYERIGDLPWERFDEIAAQLGSPQLRYPGGNAAETLFNYLDPNASVDLAGRAVMGMDAFIQYAGGRGLEPILILPTRPFLPNETHALLAWDDATGGWRIDPAAEAQARALVEGFVASAVQSAQAAGTTIAAIELGNEYSGVDWLSDSGDWMKMTPEQYGVLSGKLAQWVQQALVQAGAGGDPQVLAQIWGDFAADGFSTATLSGFNDTVLVHVGATGLAAIDGNVHHIYFREGKTSADGTDRHAYATLDDRIAEMMALSEVWEDAAGRDLSRHVSEWNVQKFALHEPTSAEWHALGREWTVSAEWRETANFGLKQLAPLLEMTAACNMAGVAGGQLWSVMYNAAALGRQDDGGVLSVPGALVAEMTRLLPGTRYVETGAEGAHGDLHVFRDGSQTHVFVSSRQDVPQTFQIDLGPLDPAPPQVDVTYFRADAAASDGRFQADGNTYVTGDAIWLEADLGAVLERTVLPLAQDALSLTLGAHEVALVSFSHGKWNLISGTEASEDLFGTDVADRILGHGGADHIRGEGGADWLLGGAGDDAIYGGTGADRIEGGDGNDYLQGGAGGFADHIFGGAGDDTLLGGAGDDRLFGARGHDVLHGDGGIDVLRGQRGRDTLSGGDGDDRLHGAASRDVLTGGAGDDVLRGDAGNDLLTGGAGADRFVFRIDLRSGSDRVTDFEPGVDTLEFRAVEEGARDRLVLTQSGTHLDIGWDMGAVRLLDTDLASFDPLTDIVLI